MADAAKVFGRRIRERRLKLGLSQEALADKVGVHRTYMGAVERGERNVSLRNILRICRALSLDPGEILRGLR